MYSILMCNFLFHFGNSYKHAKVRDMLLDVNQSSNLTTYPFPHEMQCKDADAADAGVKCRVNILLRKSNNLLF